MQRFNTIARSSVGLGCHPNETKRKIREIKTIAKCGFAGAVPRMLASRRGFVYRPRRNDGLPQVPMDVTRKRLLFRARHMGTNENDSLFGAFAEQNLSLMNNNELMLFEKLLEVSDAALFHWVSGAKPVPPEFDTVVMAKLKAFTRAGGR